ncbi:MAG: DNA helicase II / ATP-dependent DNA helicase PcrA [Parcubacteria group bacterium Greene0416_79]|nr:MAG: DNA helicase II / ATP-dependent DNA helicase PcrA [Parcubacteria group bacterium Greene0416_79]
MQHLEGLNPRQREAVLHTEGPLLIVAGAGAGKTRVITHRILHLIKKGVPPDAILAVTFTNKAAKEMRDRVSHLLTSQPTTDNQLQDHPAVVGRWSLCPVPSSALVLGWVVGSPFISTFHSLGAEILRAEHKELKVPKHFTIFDRSDSLSAIKGGMKEAGIDPKTFEPGRLLSAISREKGAMTTLEEFGARSERDYYTKVVARVWEEYEKVLKAERAFDFDDLLLRAARLLRKNERVLERYQQRFRYILIDEYQDTNRVQYEMARLLAAAHRNIAVVGDLDQMIYSWRGATIKNILEFEKEYPDAKTILLEENYRSTQIILTVANRVIAQNRMRREKTLFTKNAPGERVGLYAAMDEGDEARFVAGKAKRLIAEGVAPREIAVLFRANFQSRALEEAFLSEEVPYQVVGVRFFERKEIKDMLAYLRAAQNNGSGAADLKRILSAPARGLGKVTLLRILAGEEATLPAGVRQKVAALRAALAKMKEKIENGKLSEALKFILAASGLENALKNGSEDEQERLENLKELVAFAARYDHLTGTEAAERFLTDAALQSEQDEIKEEKNLVRLMTVHAAKGLEFEYVFVTGLEQDLFPHAPLESDEWRAEERAEEERRLFYVALTRAKKKLFLSYAAVRAIFGSRQVKMPSEFIFDIDETLLEAEEKPEGGRKTVYLE